MAVNISRSRQKEVGKRNLLGLIVKLCVGQKQKLTKINKKLTIS